MKIMYYYLLVNNMKKEILSKLFGIGLFIILIFSFIVPAAAAMPTPKEIILIEFNYKDNTTTYQGAMAHEVPWASVKHSNGYMMVDYNQIDVDFKKYNA